MEEITVENYDEDFRILQEIESQTSDNIQNQRIHKRLSVKLKVVLLPGNISDYHGDKIQGVSGDISNGGCCVMFPVPVMVGDIYRLEFEKCQYDLPLIYARCVRCRLIRDNSFETGFTFFTKIQIEESVKESQQEDLL